ncbi:PKD domain-containing protein [Flavobacterium pectinovorum]|uniref:PKD domain-containing protein n=1 Tax=Flavobacterium pectinovorum TaxID=29533 RepID=UPI001FAD1D2E|nr:PKD domain-containing protein [Flavobacterium pectinovorum]MCI9844428.1 PKD domain-containing protein [Flavobacterium pectinovorum]
MKSKVIVLFSVFVALISFSCGDDLEKAVDCVGESILLQLNHTTDVTNAKKIDYEIEYTGEYTVSSVKWTFGDGSAVQTVKGSTVSHTYATAGSYTVKADITIKKGSSSCSQSKTKTVTVN